MHQTTVRFGPDLWEDIEVEAERAGVSVAQYVRDSAMTRVAYTRGRDGDPHYEAALELVAAAETPSDTRDWSSVTRSEAAALRAETRQARRQAKALRDQAQRRRVGAEGSGQPERRPDL
jgi:hypothetical protein